MEPKNVCANIGIANSAMLARSTQSFPENDLQLGMRHAPLDLGQDSAALPASNDQSMDIDENYPLYPLAMWCVGRKHACVIEI
jgi:hypothetical protein